MDWVSESRRGEDRNLALIVTVVVASVLAAWLLSPTVAAAVAGPEYHLGDRWVYDMTLRKAGFTLDGVLTQTVESQETLAVGGGTYDAWVTSLSASGTMVGSLAPLGPDLGNATGTFVLTGEEAYETTGLKPVRTVMSVSASGLVELLGNLTAFTLYLNNTTTNEILSDTWLYPWEEGGTGTLVVNRNATESITFVVGGDPQPLQTWDAGTVTTIFSAGTLVSLATPAGTLDVLPVAAAVSDGSSSDDRYAPDAGGTADRTVYDPLGQPAMELSLLSFSYEGPEPPADPTDDLSTTLLWVGALSVLVVVVPLAAALLAKKRVGK